MQAFDSSSLVQALDSYLVPIPGTDPQNTTDEVNFDQMETDAVPGYSLVVIMPSVQQHRLVDDVYCAYCLSSSRVCQFWLQIIRLLLHLLLMRSYRFPCRIRRGGKWHTNTNPFVSCTHPTIIGTKGRWFYKLENYIADLCIVKPHYFWIYLSLFV